MVGWAKMTLSDKIVHALNYSCFNPVY
jgi:hypothetical protein